MKTINETFTDEEHKRMVKLKGKLSWRDFILFLVIKEEETKTKEKKK